MTMMIRIFIKDEKVYFRQPKKSHYLKLPLENSKRKNSIRQAPPIPSPTGPPRRPRLTHPKMDVLESDPR